MIRVERWIDAPRWLRAAVPVISLLLAALIVALVLAITGHDPFAAYGQMYDAAFLAKGGMSSTFVYATPLVFTGLCAAFAFRMRAWNIGGEGQLYLGAIGASGASAWRSGDCPHRSSSLAWRPVVSWPECSGPPSPASCEPTAGRTRS